MGIDDGYGTGYALDQLAREERLDKRDAARKEFEDSFWCGIRVRDLSHDQLLLMAFDQKQSMDNAKKTLAEALELLKVMNGRISKSGS